ncbi:MAG: DUF2508 domain-containing protein [Pygmaiobacter sp.]
MEFAAHLTTRILKFPVRENEGLAAQKAKLDYRSELKECEALLRTNETLFNLETDDILIDSRIYEREALLCRHKYLITKMRKE